MRYLPIRENLRPEPSPFSRTRREQAIRDGAPPHPLDKPIRILKTTADAYPNGHPQTVASEERLRKALRTEPAPLSTISERLNRCDSTTRATLAAFPDLWVVGQFEK